MVHRMVRKTGLFLALCLILTLFPAGLSSSLADTPGSGYINYNRVFFRKTPSTAQNAAYWAFLDFGWPVTVLGTESNTYGNWYRVECSLPQDSSTVTGYVMQRYVTLTVAPVTSAPTTAPTATPVNFQAAYINTDRVYFRREAGYHTENWTLLPIDWPVYVTGFTYVNNVKWFSVSACLPDGGDTPVSGYVHSDYVTFGTPAAVTPTPAPTDVPSVTEDPLAGLSGYALVLNTGTNVRLSPDPSSTSITALISGQIVTVLDGVLSSMIHVRFQSVDGYVEASSLKMLTEEEYAALTDPSYTTPPTASPTAMPTDVPVTPTPIPGGSLSGYAIVINDGAAVRLGADQSAVSFTSLLSGQIVTVLGDEENGMVLIRVQVLEGYIAASDIRRLTEEEYASLIDPTYTAVPSPTPTSTPTPTPTPTPAPVITAAPTPSYLILGYIQLIKGGVNLRSTPGGHTLSPSDETQLNKYTYLPYIRQPIFYGDYYWIQVYSPQLDAYGYIRSDCYQIVSSTPTPAPASDPSGERTDITGYLKLTKADVNLRQTPGGKSLTPNEEDRIYVSVPIAYYGTPVSWGGYSWALIRYNGMYGYIRSDCYEILLATDTPAPTSSPVPTLIGYIHTVADDVNIRKTPGGTILAQVKKGTIFPCYGQVNQNGAVWKLIWLDQKSCYAYVLGSLTEEYTYITPTPTLSPYTAVPTVTPTPGYITYAPVVTPTPSSVFGYVVTTVSKVYIRESSAVTSRALALTGDAGTIIIATGDPVNNGNTLWYPVLYNGYTGYISGSFVRSISAWQAEIYQSTGVVPTPSPIPVDPSMDSDHLIVTTDRVFIRTGSGFNFQTESVFANKGDIFLFYGSTADTSGSGVMWYRIDFNGKERYIHSGFVKVLSIREYEEILAAQTPTETPAPTPSPAPAASPSPEPAASAPPSSEDIIVIIPESYRLLSQGSEGSDVTELQEALYLLGYLGLDSITGTFDSDTQSAVITFQSEHDLIVTGIVDLETWSNIFLYFQDAEG